MTPANLSLQSVLARSVDTIALFYFRQGLFVQIQHMHLKVLPSSTLINQTVFLYTGWALITLRLRRRIDQKFGLIELICELFLQPSSFLLEIVIALLA
jgi:hypothetical protein